MAFHDEMTYPCNRAGVPTVYQGILGAAAKAHDTPGLFFFETVDSSGNEEKTYMWLDGSANLRFSATLPTDQDADGQVLGAGSGQMQIKKIDITANVTGEQTVWTIPNPSLIHDVYLVVTTADAGETMDVGTDGAGSNDPDGFLDGVSLNATGIVRGTCAAGAVTYGALIITETGGAAVNNVEPAIITGVASLTYTPSGTPSTMRGSIYVLYTDLS